MQNFTADPNVIVERVNRDDGNAALASDWFTICELDTLVGAGIEFVGLFIDESGSMTRSTVSTSIALFETNLQQRNLTISSVCTTNHSERSLKEVAFYQIILTSPVGVF